MPRSAVRAPPLCGPRGAEHGQPYTVVTANRVDPHPSARSALEAARHVFPLHDLLVNLAQPAADHATEQVEKLKRRVRIYGEDLVERGSVDRQHGGVTLVS